jgi:suppressor of tumorigenicity protein 13
VLNYFPKECELTRYTKMSHKLVLGCSGNSFRTCICESFVTGKLEEALQYFSEAISCNPTSAILFANRAGVYVKMKKPNAAIHDAQVALKINPDLAKGYKWRGEANALLGEWEESAKDLHLASRLDYDEEIAAVLKKVEPNVHKIEEHRRKYERLRKERDERRIAREKEVHYF